MVAMNASAATATKAVRSQRWVGEGAEVGMGEQ